MKLNTSKDTFSRWCENLFIPIRLEASFYEQVRKQVMITQYDNNPSFESVDDPRLIHSLKAVKGQL